MDANATNKIFDAINFSMNKIIIDITGVWIMHLNLRQELEFSSKCHNDELD